MGKIKSSCISIVHIIISISHTSEDLYFIEAATSEKSRQNFAYDFSF